MEKISFVVTPLSSLDSGARVCDAGCVNFGGYQVSVEGRPEMTPFRVCAPCLPAAFSVLEFSAKKR